MAKLDPVDGLKQLKRQFQSFLDAVTIIEDIGNLDNAYAEAEARLKSKREEEDALSGTLIGLAADIQTYEQKKSEWQLEAQAALSSAKESAKAALAKAEKDAEAIIAAARSASQKVQDSLVKGMEATQAQVDEKRRELISLTEQVEDKQEELAKLAKQVDKLKAQIAKVLEA